MNRSSIPELSDAPVSADSCPRFNVCNAPICPLEKKWMDAQHLQGESVCGLLSELVKPSGPALLRSRLHINVINKLEEEYEQVIARWGVIRTRLHQAARRRSKIEIGMALAQKRKKTATSAQLNTHDDGTAELHELVAGARKGPAELP